MIIKDMSELNPKSGSHKVAKELLKVTGNTCNLTKFIIRGDN
jgi:hypothetical protein